MSQSKTEKPSTPDTLTKTAKDASIALSESELNQVVGGSKSKVANKAADAVDGYIRS